MARRTPVTQREALVALTAPLFATPRRLIMLGVVVLAAVVGAAHAGTSQHGASLAQRVLVLEHACMPIYTGGGVEQCAQPSVPEQRLVRALKACFRNTAYMGGTQDDTWALEAQCLDDWNDAHPR